MSQNANYVEVIYGDDQQQVADALDTLDNVDGLQLRTVSWSANRRDREFSVLVAYRSPSGVAGVGGRVLPAFSRPPRPVRPAGPPGVPAPGVQGRDVSELVARVNPNGGAVYLVGYDLHTAAKVRATVQADHWERFTDFCWSALRGEIAARTRA